MWYIYITIRPCSIDVNTKFSIYKASCPDTYRGRYNDKTHPNQDLCALYTNEVDEIIKNIESKGKGVAAFIAESLQSCGGQVIPPAGYFDRIYRFVWA